MNIKNKPSVFVPFEFQREIEQLSKAALMDMVWDYAQQIAGSSSPDHIMSEFRARQEIILSYRQERAS